MIRQNDLFLPKGSPFNLEGGAEIYALEQINDRPAAVLIKALGDELRIAGFAGQRYSQKAGALMPICSIIRWKGNDFILGLCAIVIVSLASLSKCDLFRKPSEDSGFYHTDWIEGEGRLFCIYEGGIVAISSEGDVLWHSRKAWDDIFTGFQDSDLVIMESDGHTVAIDAATGNRTPPPPDSPPSTPYG